MVAGLTEMSQRGRSQVLKAIEGLHPSGSTNLWDGLKVGMDLLQGVQPKGLLSQLGQKSNVFSFFKTGKQSQTQDQAASSSSKDPLPTPRRFSTLLILTDGMPNVEPPRGHIPVLKSYLNAMDNNHAFNISTFGFGYSLSSKLLAEISQVGGGGYSFIPDSGIVGTVFVNAVANAYATCAPQVRLDVEIPEGNTVEVKGSLPVTQTSWGVQIAAGDMQFGQTMDLVLAFSEFPEEITATLSYRPSAATENCKLHATLSKNSLPPQLAPVRYHAARLSFVEIIGSIDDSDLPGSRKLLEDLGDSILRSPLLANYADALALEKDLSGECKLALESANYLRWGRHYLPSLARSHQRQQCGNFKDPGLQVYGRDSPIFIQERDKLDAAFMALPPPKPSVPPRINPSTGKSSFVKLGSMSTYYNSSGPCFAGDCLVTLPAGRYMKVEELKRGMEVQTLTGTNEVAAVLRTAMPSGEALLCRIGGLKITPWHPIVSPAQTGTWVFPADVASPELMPCDAVYSVLLHPSKDAGNANAHSLSIAGVWCVTLGHGLTSTVDSDVRSHAFLGDYERVLRELSYLEGFLGDGVVQCVRTRRDPNGTICGFVGESETKMTREWGAQSTLQCM